MFKQVITEGNLVSSSFSCKFCDSVRPSGSFFAQEMMYGTRERFEYQQCADCGSLQLVNIPNDLDRHYQFEAYSSWHEPPDYIRKVPSPLRRLLQGWRAEDVMHQDNIKGRVLRRMFGEPNPAVDVALQGFDWDWFSQCNLRVRDRVFDLGCGSGNLLFFLRASGFRDLHGYDAFSGIRCDEAGLMIHDKYPQEIRGTCRLAMAHHVLEHMPDPLSALRLLVDAISDDGFVLVRVPIASSWAFREYGANWVQLDAPRHVVIPSEKGMRALADRIGLNVVFTKFDSGLFQFIGSESYRAGVPMFPDPSVGISTQAPAFDAAWKSKMINFASELNARHEGDQAGFIFTKA
jgi:hypothetical protein